MWIKVPVPCSSVLCTVTAVPLETSKLKRVQALKPKRNGPEVTVPDFFKCPISLELMRDPVTTCTGQSYDRSSIEKWLEEGHRTCPSTRQVLENTEIVPNHTLRRLIQEWQVCNRSNGVERMPTPKQPADFYKVKGMLQEVAQGCYGSLRKLRAVAKESDRNRRVVAEAGAIPMLLSNFVFSPDCLGKNLEACEEALAILVLLPLANIRKLFYIGPKQLTAISWLLCRGSIEGRVNAASLLGMLSTDDEMKLSVGSTAGAFEGLVQLLKEDQYPKAIKAGLKAFLSIGGPVRNREKAVEAGAVSAIMEILPEAGRSNTERALTLLELLCTRVSGRAAVSAHALAVPVLVRVISRVSALSTEKAVSCLWSVCQHSPKECVDEAAVQAGVLTQLLHLSQVDYCTSRTKQKATELLGQLRHRWKDCDRQIRSQSKS